MSKRKAEDDISNEQSINKKHKIADEKSNWVKNSEGEFIKISSIIGLKMEKTKNSDIRAFVILEGGFHPFEELNESNGEIEIKRGNMFIIDGKDNVAFLVKMMDDKKITEDYEKLISGTTITSEKV